MTIQMAGLIPKASGSASTAGELKPKILSQFVVKPGIELLNTLNTAQKAAEVNTLYHPGQNPDWLSPQQRAGPFVAQRRIDRETERQHHDRGGRSLGTLNHF